MKSVFNYLKFHAMALFSVGLRGMSVALGFAVTFYLGHQMGPEANGFYALIAQTALLLSAMVVGGLDLAIVRDFSAAVVAQKPPSFRSFTRITMIALAAAIVVMTVFLLARQNVLADLNAPGAPAAAMLMLSILFVGRAIARVTGAFLRSQRAYILGQIVESIMIPGIATLGIVLRLAPTLDAVLYWTIAGSIAASVMGILGSLRLTSRAPDAHEVSAKTVVKTAIPLWGVAVSRDFGEWYGLAVVAALLSVYDAGMFRVAMQITWALTIITLGLFSVFSPRIAAAYAKRDYQYIARLTRSSTMLAIVLVLPVALLIFPLAGPILAIIGEEFRAGSLLLQILIVGQTIVVSTGPTGLTLALTGHERVNLMLTLISLVALLISVPLAATYGGLVWVGIVISVVTAGRNIAALIAVRRLLGIATFTGRYTPPPSHLAANSG